MSRRSTAAMLRRTSSHVSPGAASRRKSRRVSNDIFHLRCKRRHLLPLPVLRERVGERACEKVSQPKTPSPLPSPGVPGEGVVVLSAIAALMKDVELKGGRGGHR